MQGERRTIWDNLVEKLGRNPSNAECKAECLRIIDEGVREAAEAGKLSWQRPAKDKRATP